MSLIIESRNLDGTISPIDGSVEEKTFDVTENAEEGSVAMSVVTVDDPDLAFDINGHRLFRIRDTDIVSGESVIYAGYTADRTFKRGRMPLSRQVDLSVADINSVWGRRVMVGADCKRPAETDVARMRWLISTAEAGLIDDDTYLSSSSPVNMDKVDYRGQMMDQVANDCAQASGKNWGLTYLFSPGHGFQVWYGHDELTTYDSGVLITNILGDVDDETSFYMAEDTTLTIDPARVFSGVMVDWEKGKVYRQLTATAHAFARRDTIMNGKLVKTKTKAIARANRYLGTLNEEDVRIETSILVPRRLANVVRPFQRVQFQSTHLPGTIDAPIYCRVVRRRLSYWTPEFWRMGLTLVGGASAGAAASCSTSLSGTTGVIYNDQAFHTPGEINLSVTPDSGEDSVIVASVLSSNTNVPTDETLVATSPSVLVFEDNVSTGAPLGGQIYRVAGAASGSYALQATFTPGYGADNNSVWCAVAAALRTSATSPVQSKGLASDNVVHVTLDSTPTPGNMLVMSTAVRQGSDPATTTSETYPTTGWTLIGHAYAYSPHDGGGPFADLWARCVSEGDGSEYGAGASGSGNYAVTVVSEWEIT